MIEGGEYIPQCIATGTSKSSIRFYKAGSVHEHVLTHHGEHAPQDTTMATRKHDELHREDDCIWKRVRERGGEITGEEIRRISPVKHTHTKEHEF